MNDKFLLLLDANRILNSTLDIKKLLTIILELASRVVNAEASSLLLIDEQTGELYFDVAIGEKADEIKRIRLKPGEGVAGWCAAYNRSVIVEDVTKDPRWTRRSDDTSGFVTKSIICVPMRYKGRVLGVIEGINPIGKAFFTDDDLPVLEAFANQTAVALENARLFTKLTQEREKIAAAFDGMTEAVFVTDREGVITQSNMAACKLIDKKDINGSLFEKVMTESEFSIPAGFLQFDERIKVFEITKKTRKQIFLNCVATKIVNDRAETTGYIFVIRDITDEKKEEFVKRTFLSLISHKLKTPLVTISGYLPMLLAEDSLILKPSIKKALEAMKSQSNRLVGLVTDLLRYTVIETEALELDRKKISVEQLVAETLGIMKEKMKDAKIEVVSLSELGEVFVDTDKMKEALGCILENAVKFNKVGDSEGAEKIVKISGELQTDAVAISIEDNSVGIPLAEQEKIFDKFYQIEESFTGQVAGAGLGLPLAKRIVEAHNGSINVNSKVGVGSTFTVKIPRFI
ncbi:MAG: ATP-binding protein [Elusimicrobiota bacterium]